jgi:hypothetical protein
VAEALINQQVEIMAQFNAARHAPAKSQLPEQNQQAHQAQPIQSESPARQQTTSIPPPATPRPAPSPRIPIAGLKIVDHFDETVFMLSQREILRADIEPGTDILHLEILRRPGVSFRASLPTIDETLSPEDQSCASRKSV